MNKDFRGRNVSISTKLWTSPLHTIFVITEAEHTGTLHRQFVGLDVFRYYHVSVIRQVSFRLFGQAEFALILLLVLNLRFALLI